MTVATLVHSNIVRSHYPKTGVHAQKKARKYLAGVLLFAIFAFGFLYVLETNNIAARDYKIRELQKQAKELDTINKLLQVEVSNLKSINILEANSNNLEMVKAQKVDYVSFPQTNAMLIAE